MIFFTIIERGLFFLERKDLRNIAIIAHVDHGKTTLVDELLKQSGLYRENEEIIERVMDNNDLERERGITIIAKNTSVKYRGVKINIVDTPGHADFGGEVERVLKMVNGVLLLVDAFEGPMPQTRFVLQKALELNHKVIIVINKIDRPAARPAEVVDEVLELLLDLDATSEQLDSPIVYCSAREGTASLESDQSGQNMAPVFDAIIEHIPAPEGEPDQPLQMLVSSIDYNEYVGRIGIGKIDRGTVKQGDEVMICDYNNNEQFKSRIVNLYQIEGLARVTAESAMVGDIVCFSGVEDITIGNTVCSVLNPEPLPFVNISEPTVEMIFMVNDSPFAGQEGKYVTSRHLKDRLFKELLKNVSMHIYETDSPDRYRVLGRGEMHISILIETMRREGYEFQVSTPKVLLKEIEGIVHEPMERLLIDVPKESVGVVMEKMGMRKAEMLTMQPKGERMSIEFSIPARCLFGYRDEFLTDTYGEGILNSVFDGYEPYKGDFKSRKNGSLIAFEDGVAVTYGLFNAQERGILFISPGTAVYAGMIVGISPKDQDIAVNVCKKKHITNMRASGSDETLRLVPPRKMSLENCLEFIGDDELVEITPKSIRMRKSILDHSQRLRNFKMNNN